MPKFSKKLLEREGKNGRNEECLSKSNFSPSFGCEHQLFNCLVLEDVWILCFLPGCLVAAGLCDNPFFFPFLTTKATSCFKERYWKVLYIVFSNGLKARKPAYLSKMKEFITSTYSQSSKEGRDCCKRGSTLIFG